jgi:hypothetical protein
MNRGLPPHIGFFMGWADGFRPSLVNEPGSSTTSDDLTVVFSSNVARSGDNKVSARMPRNEASCLKGDRIWNHDCRAPAVANPSAALQTTRTVWGIRCRVVPWTLRLHLRRVDVGDLRGLVAKVIAGVTQSQPFTKAEVKRHAAERF